MEFHFTGPSRREPTSGPSNSLLLVSEQRETERGSCDSERGLYHIAHSTLLSLCYLQVASSNRVSFHQSNTELVWPHVWQVVSSFVCVCVCVCVSYVLRQWLRLSMSMSMV